MPRRNTEYWLQKAAQTRKAAEQMSGTSKATMLEIAKLYDRLAEQARELEAFSAASKK